MTLDCPLYEQTPDPQNASHLLNWTLPAGEVLLDGANAKKFVTYRYLQSDFGRARRQQQLIWAIRNQAIKIDLIPRIPELWKGLSAAFETDLSLLDVIGLARFGLELKPENVRGTALDHDVVKGYVTSGGAAVLVDQGPADSGCAVGRDVREQAVGRTGQERVRQVPSPAARLCQTGVNAGFGSHARSRRSHSGAVDLWRLNQSVRSDEEEAKKIKQVPGSLDAVLVRPGG